MKDLAYINEAIYSIHYWIIWKEFVKNHDKKVKVKKKSAYKTKMKIGKQIETYETRKVSELNVC